MIPLLRIPSGSSNRRPLLRVPSGSSNGRPLLRVPTGSSNRRPRLGSSPGLAIALSRTSSAGSYMQGRPMSEPLQKGHMLGEGEIIDEVGIAGRTIYIIRGPDGQPTGVRKIAYHTDDRPGHFAVTQNEARIYNQIIAENPEEWRDHLIPYRNSAANSVSVIIDFDWVDGADIRSYLAENPQDATTVFYHVARQLRWLAEKGYVHGDIDLGNFFRTTDGRILILDLGLSHKRLTVQLAHREKAAFMHIIRPFVKQNLIFYLDSKPFTMPLADFYLSASRKLRKSTRATRKARDTQRRHTPRA